MLDVLSDDVNTSLWIDGLQWQIKLWRLAIPKVLDYINVLSDTKNEAINDMASLFPIIEQLLRIINRDADYDDTDFLGHDD